eukprot:6220933-Pyramimonas_sp.AAC.1
MSIAAKRAILLLQNIVREDLDIAKSTRGVEEELVRWKGRMIYQIYNSPGRHLATRFVNKDHTKLCTIRRMHILSKYNMRLGITILNGGGESGIRNILILEKELEPTQTCIAPVDLNPTQTLAQMGITDLAQVATKAGYMFAMGDLSKIFGDKFGSVQRDAYCQLCKTLCKGGEEEGPKTRGAHPKATYWNVKRNRELHDRFKQLLTCDKSGTLEDYWEKWDKQQRAPIARCYTGSSTLHKGVKRSKKAITIVTQAHNFSTFCLGDVLTEVPVHPTGEVKQTVNISREGENFQVPVSSIPVDLMLRSYGEEWKRAFEQLKTSSENEIP